MPILLNARHELFSQGIASGLTPAEAYVQAGFNGKGAAQSASALLTNPNVSERVNALLRQRGDAVIGAAVKSTRLTVEAHMKRLQELQDMAVTVEDGKGLPTALRAEELRGRVSGLYVDKKNEQPGPFDHLRPDELAELEAAIDALLASRNAQGGTH